MDLMGNSNIERGS